MTTIQTKRDTLKCRCGSEGQVPSDWESAVCTKCNRMWLNQGEGFWLPTNKFVKADLKDEAQKMVILCETPGCHKSFPVTGSGTRECYKCGAKYESTADGEWKRQELPAQMTLGDLKKVTIGHKEKFVVA